ncbi:MAG: SPFH domain-containing protein [Bacteroidota bacterium]
MRSSLDCFLCMGLLLLFLSSCLQTPTPASTPYSRDQVFQCQLTNIRLADGVPLGMDIAIRWTITDESSFFAQFDEPTSYHNMILSPRSRELAASIANTYPSVDSVFGMQRFSFMEAFKQHFTDKLGEEGVEIKEVIIAEISFPNTFTKAKEQIGLKEQQLAAIRQQSIVDVEQAQASKKRAEADGLVAIAQAQAQGRLEKIQADIEASRRRRQLALAETDKQVSEKQAEAEARRQELLALADLKKQTDLKDLEVQRERELEMLKVDKQKAIEQLAWDQQLQLAKLCAENPNYASFLVNKELASHVQIAVLPSDGSSSMFGDFLKQGMTQTVSQSPD